MNKFILFLTSILSAQILYAQDTLTLEKAIEIALQNNYSIVIAKNAEKIAENNNRLGNAGFLPQLNLNYGNTNGITNSKTVIPPSSSNPAGTVREGHDVKTHNYTGSALVNWTVFDGFNMFINRNRLEELAKAGEYQARMNIEITVSQVINTYYAIVQQEKLLGVIQNAINLSVYRYKLAEAMKNIGSASQQTLLQSMVDANADSTRLIQQMNAMRNSKSDLNRLLARDVNTPFEVKDDLKVDPGLKLGELQEKLDKQNAQALAQRAAVNIAQYAVQGYQSQYLPVLGVFGGYNFNKSLTPVGVSTLNQSNGLTYGFTASLNVFNGGVTTLNVQNAKILLKSSKAQYEDTKLMLHNDLNKYFNNYTSSMQLLRIQQSNVEIAKKDVDIAVGRYKLGNITDVDLRVTQQKLIDAENSLLVAEYTAKQAEIEMKRLTGEILSVY